ncbi:unnamed protein product [Dibothriocephalus latus]|uniref:Band 3 cytoplasmic domain-containing protein n=1 Tax=Dibothriocephalus latus TaxID=60516 RepID=A0A3P7LRR3_DIBLA|nr:unnamed protein product [Dibothriocephalus latus]
MFTVCNSTATHSAPHRQSAFPLCFYFTSIFFARPLSPRWIKFEEEVEEYADRWSKPHVAVQSLMSVFEVRSCLAKAVMLLDLEATTLESITGESCCLRPERLGRLKPLPVMPCFFAVEI